MCPFTRQDKTTYNQRESGNRLSTGLGYMRGDQGGFFQVDHEKIRESKGTRQWNNLENCNI